MWLQLSNVLCFFKKSYKKQTVAFFLTCTRVPGMRILIFLGIFLATCLYPTLCAQNGYSLGEVLSLTLLNNPDLDAFSYDIRGTDAKILQASFRPNPAIDIETENLGAPHFVQTTFLLSQVIELGGKQRARVQFAKRERDRVLLDYEVKKRELFVETTLLFIDVLVNQREVAFLEDYVKVLQEFSSSVIRRSEAGKASIIEEANFSVLLATATIDLQKAYNDLINSKLKLAAQWGETNCEAFIAIGDLEWIPPVITLEELGALLPCHPQIIRSSIESTLREARIALEKSNAYPDLNVRGGPRYLREAQKWVWVVGIFVPLPIYDRNQGRIWEAAENWKKLEKEREALWVKLLRELNNSYSKIQSTFSELTILKNVILPASQEAFDSSYQGYESARYSYLELLETERIYRNSKIRYLEALGEYHKALAQLEGLAGSKAIINQECE